MSEEVKQYIIVGLSLIVFVILGRGAGLPWIGILIGVAYTALIAFVCKLIVSKGW